MRKHLTIRSFILGAACGIAAVACVTAFAETSTRWRDVLPGQWYSEAVEYSANWLKGYDDAHYGVSEPVTRSQLATVLMRFDQESQRDIDNNKKMLADAAAIICLNANNLLPNKDLLSDPADGEIDGLLRYRTALKELCSSNWHWELKWYPFSQSPAADASSYSKCISEYDPHTGDTILSFCGRLP